MQTAVGVEAPFDRLDVVAAKIVLVADVKRLVDVTHPMAEKEQRFRPRLVGGGVCQSRGVMGDTCQDAVAVAVTVLHAVGRARNVQEVPGFERVELVPSRHVVSGLVSRLVREDTAFGEEPECLPVRFPIGAGQPSDFGLPGRIEQLVRDPTDDAVTVRTPGGRVPPHSHREAGNDRGTLSARALTQLRNVWRLFVGTLVAELLVDGIHSVLQARVHP